MIALDASALLAIFLNEPQRDNFLTIVDKEQCIISAINFVETAIVWEFRSNGNAAILLDDFIREAEIKIVPVTAQQAYIARKAYRLFGKGWHQAKLNICDCFAYAVAKDYDIPLLYIGNDFAHTDIKTFMV